MTEKIGVQPYLGIHIDYDREEKLNTFSKQTIVDRISRKLTFIEKSS